MKYFSNDFLYINLPVAISTEKSLDCLVSLFERLQLIVRTMVDWTEHRVDRSQHPKSGTQHSIDDLGPNVDSLEKELSEIRRLFQFH